MKKIITYLFCIVVFSTAALPAFAATKTSTRPFENLFYYVPGFTTYYSFETNASNVGVFAPQVYTFDMNGNLTGSLSDLVKGVITTNKTKVMPLVANADFDPTLIDTVLKSQTAQTKLINALVTEAQTNHYTGWQLDIEAIPAADRDLYSAFVASAEAAMHRNKLLLSVAVVARTSNNPSDLPTGSWDKWAGVYDYAAIAKSADFISLMSYDQPASPGPVSSLPWFKQVIAFALKDIPKSKLSIGLPTYGWQWNTDTNKRIGSISYTKVADLLASKKYIAKGYDTSAGEAWITYQTTTGGVTTHYKIWYENAQSLKTKLAIAKADHVRGVSVWVMGMEDPAMWNLFK